MNDALAHERLVGVLELIDRWGELYNRRWGKRGHAKDGSLAAQVNTLIDEVRTRTKLAHDVIAAMGEEANGLAFGSSRMFDNLLTRCNVTRMVTCVTQWHS